MEIKPVWLREGDPEAGNTRHATIIVDFHHGFPGACASFWFSTSVIATFANVEIKPAKYFKSIMFDALDLNPLS